MFSLLPYHAAQESFLPFQLGLDSSGLSLMVFTIVLAYTLRLSNSSRIFMFRIGYASGRLKDISDTHQVRPIYHRAIYLSSGSASRLPFRAKDHRFYRASYLSIIADNLLRRYTPVWLLSDPLG